MLDLVVFGSLCDSLKVVSVPGRGSSSGLSQWESGVLFEFVEVGGALVVCTVVGCMFSTTSNRGKTDHGRGCGSRVPAYEFLSVGVGSKRVPFL